MSYLYLLCFIQVLFSWFLEISASVTFSGLALYWKSLHALYCLWPDPKAEHMVLSINPFNYHFTTFWLPGWNMPSHSHVPALARLRRITRKVCVMKY